MRRLPIHIPRARGEAHPQAKFTFAQAERIRDRREKGHTYADLAAMFGCSISCIRNICMGTRYTEPQKRPPRARR